MSASGAQKGCALNFQLTMVEPILMETLEIVISVAERSTKGLALGHSPIANSLDAD